LSTDLLSNCLKFVVGMFNDKLLTAKTQQATYNKPLAMIDLASGICYATWD